MAIRGGPAKTVGRETGARVRIPPSPPKETSQKLVRQRGEAHHLVLDDSINIPLSTSMEE